MLLDTIRDRVIDYIAPSVEEATDIPAESKRTTELKHPVIKSRKNSLTVPQRLEVRPRARGITKKTPTKKPVLFTQDVLNKALLAKAKSPSTPTSNSSDDSAMNVKERRETSPPINLHELDNFFNALEEQERRQALDAIDRSTWTEGEVELFNRLNMRGFDPMLPAHWHMDFPTMPEQLFTSDPHRQIFRAIHGSDFRASTALVSLLGTGSRIRDRTLEHHPPEPWTLKKLNAFARWAYEDGSLVSRQPIPALTIASRRPGEGINPVVDRITLDLHALAARWRDFFRVRQDGSTAYEPHRREDSVLPVGSDGRPRYVPALPTLVGLVIAHTVVAVVTYDAALENGEVRNLATFDFSEMGQDVWNAVAVGMVVVWVRDWLVRLDLPEVEVEMGGVDVDA